MDEAPGPVALVGSGEYLPVMDVVERRLLAGRPARFVQLATAAAPEGVDSLARWHSLGLAAAERIGVQQVVVPVMDRISADDPALAGLIQGAGLIYLSGGNPSFLADTLRGTLVWAAIEAAWRAGAALAGCSAGAMALGASVPNLRNPLRAPVPGLGLVPQVRVLPHFDRFAAHLPDAVLGKLTGPTSAVSAPGVTTVGIDEETALVGGLVGGLAGWPVGGPAGGPVEWEVVGSRSVWVLTGSGREEYAAGARLSLAR